MTTKTILTSILANGKEEVAFPPFTVRGQGLYLGKKQIFQLFSGTLGLIVLSARNGLKTANEHSVFDAFLLELTNAKIATEYVVSVAAFMNPEGRFQAFLAGKGAPGIELTADELALAATYKSVHDKFIKAFTPPPPPPPVYVFVGVERGKALFVKDGNVRRDESRFGYSMTLDEAKRIWRLIQPFWLKNPPGSRALQTWVGRASSSNGRTDAIRVSPARLEIGCQGFTRSQIERLALSQGWITKPTPATKEA